MKQFASPASDDKLSLWRAYELMETMLGNSDEAQNVYQRFMREFYNAPVASKEISATAPLRCAKELPSKSKEVEVVLWSNEKKSKKAMGRGQVWLNHGSIEGKVPASRMVKIGRRTKEIESNPAA